MASLTNPILIHSHRGGLIENEHRGAYIVVDPHGDVISAAGHYQSMIYARSSLKPINVLAMIESGAADHFNVTDEEIALACASHSGEEIHVQKVAAWLDRIGCTLDDLECGIHAPIAQSARRELQKRGEQPNNLHNACSGKHAGFLTLTKFLDAPIKGYSKIDHPTQKAIMKTAAQMVDIKVDETPKGIDGCCIPMMGMPMMNLAIGMTKLVAPNDLETCLKDSCQRVIQAMQTHPFCVGGTNRFDTKIIEHTKGQVLVKMGADGVFSAVIPKKKWGIALKVDDGNLIAAEAAMFHLLRRLELLDKSLYQEDGPLSYWMKLPINNYHKEQVGYFESAF